MSRTRFWTLIGLASILVALAAATFSAAAFAIPLEGSNIHTFGYTEILGRPTSLDWSSDRFMLIAALLFVTGGLTTYAVAGRARGDGDGDQRRRKGGIQT